jgi:NADPH2:quinone reductase
MTMASGVLGTDRPLPYIGGVEGSGVVVSGDGFAPGTQVLVRGAGVGMQRDGCWATFVSAPASAVLEVPSSMAPELAATFFQPTCAAYIAVHDVAGLDSDETVIVVGATGAVGSQVVQLALAAGARVIGVVGREPSLSRLHPGVEPVLLSDAAAIEGLAGSRPGTLLVDTLGGPELGNRLAWVRSGGRAVVVGYLLGMSATIEIPTWMMAGVTLLPMNMLQQDGRARSLAPTLAARVASGDLRIDLETFTPDQAVGALQRLRDGDIRGRAVMSMV